MEKWFLDGEMEHCGGICSSLGFQVTLWLFISLPILLPPSQAFPLEKERQFCLGRVLIFFSWEDVACHLSLGQSSTACALHAPFLRKKRGRIHLRCQPEGHSCKEQNTLYEGEVLHFAKIMFKKSQIWDAWMGSAGRKRTMPRTLLLVSGGEIQLSELLP